MIEKRVPQWAKSVHSPKLLRKMDAESNWKAEDRTKGGDKAPKDRAHDDPPDS
jgi:hypothetical protein